MLTVIRTTWALLLGMLLLQIGNGLQSSLMGVRGDIEGFTTFELSLIASAYFVGFLGGTRFAPIFIAKVGHVRVFAALGSLISATLIMFPVITEPSAWMGFRIIMGFSLSGIYVTAEGWLNNSATNQTRGQTLSAYMLVQMIGLISAQGVLSAGDPSGFILFIIPSVLVSLSFAPILLSVQPAPAFSATRSMGLLQLFKASPFGMVGMTLMGAVFAAQFGMSSVYATSAGFNLQQLSAFVSSIFVGALLAQYPIGWLSDRMDRRIVIVACAALGGALCMIGGLFPTSYIVVLGLGVLTGGLSQPLYSLLIAYTNDYLQPDEMAGASAGLLFVNGLGAIVGPPAIGLAMGAVGPGGFWLFLGTIMLVMAAYGIYRMTRRPSAYNVEKESYDAVPYANILPGAASVVFHETAQELYVEAAEEMASDGSEGTEQEKDK